MGVCRTPKYIFPNVSEVVREDCSHNILSDIDGQDWVVHEASLTMKFYHCFDVRMFPLDRQSLTITVEANHPTTRVKFLPYGDLDLKDVTGRSDGPFILAMATRRNRDGERVMCGSTVPACLKVIGHADRCFGRLDLRGREPERLFD